MVNVMQAAIDRPLPSAFMATATLEALDRVKREHTLASGDMRIFQRLADFFKDALEGRQLVQKQAVAPRGAEKSESYGIVLRVVVSLRREKRITEGVEAVLTALKQGVDELAGGHVVSASALATLQTFFERLRSLAFASIPRPTERVQLLQ